MSRAALLPNSKSDADNIYYTASIINNNTSTAGVDQDPIARFIETRDTPILKDANDFEVNVLKVVINGGGKTLPIMIPQIQPTSTFKITSAVVTTGVPRTVPPVPPQTTPTVIPTSNVVLTLDITSPTFPYAFTFGDPVVVAGWTVGDQVNMNGSFPILSVDLTLGTVTYNSLNATTNGTYAGTATTLATGPSDPNLTIYSVSLNAVVYAPGQGFTNDLAYVTSDEVFLSWISENFDLATLVPTSAYPSQVDTAYYYLYTYNHWMVVVNNALTKAYTILQANIAKVPGLTSYTLANRCPTMEFDENTRKFSFYTDTLNTAWGNTEGPPFYDKLGPGGTNVFPNSGQASNEFLFVGYNLNFDGLMTNFDTQYYGLNQVIWSTQGWNALGTPTTIYVPENTLLVRNKTGTNIQNEIDPASGAPYTQAVLNYVTTQDFESVSTLWSPVGAIVLTTQLLPVRNEFVSSPVQIGSGNLKGAQGSAAFQTVLLDFFSERFQYADDFRGLLSFEPTSEFIPVSMTQSHQEVKSIDFLVSWRNRLTNQLVPLRISNSSSISVRLLFRRKE
jgi:hypothetical protein